jgi:hypothetical protein
MGIQAATKNEITVYLFRVFPIAAMKLFVRISVCTFAFISQAFAECYYPDGKVASGLTPCNSTAKVSHCCRDADVCLSNGLCFSTGLGTIIRRGCTDSSFNDTVCPAFCIKDAGGMFRYLPRCSTVSWGKADRARWSGKLDSSDALFTPCGGYGIFCCGQDSAARSCCDAGNDTITIGGGDVMRNDTGTSDQPLKDSLNKKTNTVTGLAVALGCIGLVLAGVLFDWNRKRLQLSGPPGLRHL